MFQRIPRSIWLVTCLLAVLMGIWPGIVLVQANWLFFGALLGWLGIVHILFTMLVNRPGGDSGFWIPFLTTLGYPLAMLVYSACAYWTMRSTHSVRSGLVVSAVAAFISALASIPVAIVALSIVQHTSFFSTLFFYQSTFLLHVFILINLLISALFGWLIARRIIRSGRGAKQ